MQTVWAELTFPQSCPPGHFYSPIPARREIEQDATRIFRRGEGDLPEINQNQTKQLELLGHLAKRARELELPGTPLPGKRFYLQNDYFTCADAMTLATMLLELRPKRYLEIGSGYSSALALDIRGQFMDGQMNCCFVEPDDRRLRSLLSGKDSENVRIFKQRVQAVDDKVFQELGDGDFLFVDSSHVSKVGSDLNDILFRILPLLKPGVYIHFHDIFWPFEYNRQDVLGGRSWNEAYFIRAFLANNAKYQIVLFPSWLEHSFSAEWLETFPDASDIKASSLWLRKV